MGTPNFWLRVLNVYPEEKNIVKRLYLFQFFQGAGIAFFFTSAFAQFLEKFSITELPWVMIYSAFLLWLFGFIYTKLEHSLNFERFNTLIILFMAGSMVLFWAANQAATPDWFLYVMMSWFYVLYFLNNMEFWGIAAIAFDLRQSKRLFAVISAGDIPAKFLGYSIALVIVPFTGTHTLILIGAFFMLGSLLFFRRISRLDKLEVHHHHPHHSHKEKAKRHTPHKISKLVYNLATNSYIRRIATISLITSACILLISYGFYGEVKKEYSGDVALAKFIAFFSGALRIIAIITKMVFTSRLNASVGIKSSLYITPVGLLLLIALVVAAEYLSHNAQLIFYLFGAAYVIVDVLRTALNTPVLLTLMQPLQTHDRLRAHNIVKGIMDPFASLFSGLLLLTLLHFYDKVDLMFLCYVLMILGGLWIIGVVFVNRHYLQILSRTIGNRYFGSEEFDLNNAGILQQIRTKLVKGTDAEVINILRILNDKKGSVADDLIAELLHHPSDHVKLEVLRLINTRRTTDVKVKLEAMVHAPVSPEVKSEVIKTLCRIGTGDWELAAFMADNDERIRRAAITGMLGNNDNRIKNMAVAAIRTLSLSGKKEDKISILAILEEVKDAYHHPAGTQLLNDPDPEIRDMAMKTIGKATNHETLHALFNYISTNERSVMVSFYNAGDRSLPLLKERILQNDLPEHLQERLISLCGKIGGDKGKEALLDLLKELPQYTPVIIKSLYRSKYLADPDTRKQLEAIARAYMTHGAELLNMQQRLMKTDPRYEVLNSSLSYEIQEIREVLLCLFGCIYDRDKINRAKFGLSTAHKESVANAMEIIELTVKKDIGRHFNLMFETTSVEQRCQSLSGLFSTKEFKQVEHILERILSEKPVHYYTWTKACSMYISKKYAHPLANNLYSKYVGSGDRLLKETALFATVNS